jgi:hypothetical protein
MGVQAASPSIGFITAQGSFQLDNSRIWGNATLFDGSIVETKAVPSRIHLSNGSDIRLAAESKVRFFQGRAVIEKGSIQLQASAGYRVEARTFQISAGAPNTVAGVGLRGAGGVSASTQSGQLLIANAQGLLLADVTAGKGVSLTPEPPSAAGQTKLTGCLVSRKGSLILNDQASNITVQVYGGGVESEVGNRIAISGTTDGAASKTAGASQVIHVSQVTRLEAGVCTAAALPGKSKTAKIAGAAGTAGAAGGVAAGTAGAAAALSTAGTVAIVGGVAVAATVGGAAAAGVFSSSSTETQPNTSR